MHVRYTAIRREIQAKNHFDARGFACGDKRFDNRNIDITSRSRGVVRVPEVSEGATRDNVRHREAGMAVERVGIALI